MSTGHLSFAEESARKKQSKKHEVDVNAAPKITEISDEKASISKSDNSRDGDIILDASSQVVEALEQELSKRKKRIVTSFQLQEITSSSRSNRRPSVSSNILIWSKAEEHFASGQSCGENDQIKSISLLTKAISLKPTECKYYVERGERFLQICDFQSAILNYKKACILDPDDDVCYSRLAAIYYIKGQCLFDHKNYADALECFSRAAEMKPNEIGYHTRSVVCLAALQRHGECLALVNKKLNMENSNADLLVMRARLHLLFRNDDLSYCDIMDALKINPYHSEAKQMLEILAKKADTFKEQGVKLQLMGKIPEALLKFSTAIKSNPGCAEYHIFRGALYRQLADFNSAIDDYLLAMDKTNHDYTQTVYKEAQRHLLLCYNDFAVHCFSKGFYEEAVVLLNKAIKEEKNEKGLYINRGDCFFRLCEFDFSLNDYNQALEMDSKDCSVKVRLSVVYNELGLLSYADKLYIQALEYFSLAIQCNPKVAVYYASRARARYMLEDYEGAKHDVLRCLGLEPNQKSVMSLFSRLYPGKSIDDLLQSPTGALAIQSVQTAIREVFPLNNYPVKSKGSKDLAMKSVLPPINEQKMKLCLEEKDFLVNELDKTRSSKMVKKALNDRKSLKSKAPRISTETKQVEKESFKFAPSKDNSKSLMDQRTGIKVGAKRLTFLKA